MKKYIKKISLLLALVCTVNAFQTLPVYAQETTESVMENLTEESTGESSNQYNTELPDVLSEIPEIVDDSEMDNSQEDVSYGHQKIDGKHYYFDPETGAMHKGELKDAGYWYYFDEETGVMATGWTEHHGKIYYYDSEGRMQYGIQEIEGKKYYFHVIYGTKETGEVKYNGNWYYFDKDGVMATGWTEHHGKTYYYDSEGRMQYGIQELEGKKYYFHVVYGNKVTGEAKYNGNWYYLDENGVMATGWTEHHGKTYYYDSEGRMQYGIKEIDGKHYYFHLIYGNKVTGEAKYNGNWYYFNKDGVMATGWTEHHGKTYYYDSEGRMQYGIQELEGKKYYFHPVYGTKQTDAEAKVNGNWYYFDKDGVMATGWTEHHGNKYYYDMNGCMVYGEQVIDEKVYRFHPITGVLISENGIRVLDPNKPMIALTFDDGPSSYTPRILDKLEEYGQAATFFVVGYNAKRYTSTIKRAYNIGCEIGNHTYNHPDLTGYSYSGIKNELSSVETIIYNATGAYSTVMRPPYGSYNSTVRNAVNTPIIMWSIDTLDWKTRDTWSTVNSVMNNLSDGEIVLMHDIHSPTISAVEILIPKLVAKGYQLVTVSELAYYKGNGMQAGSAYFCFD